MMMIQREGLFADRGHVFRGYMFVSVLKDGKKGLEGSEKCVTGWLYRSVENRNEWYCRSFFFFFVCKKSITRYFDALGFRLKYYIEIRNLNLHRFETFSYDFQFPRSPFQLANKR